MQFSSCCMTLFLDSSKFPFSRTVAACSRLRRVRERSVSCAASDCCASTDLLSQPLATISIIGPPEATQLDNKIDRVVGILQNPGIRRDYRFSSASSYNPARSFLLMLPRGSAAMGVPIRVFSLCTAPKQFPRPTHSTRNTLLFFG